MGASIQIKLLLLLSLAVGSLCAEFRAFYFVQQWLGSYCNQRGTRCCYPETGKIRQDFTIYGLWPYMSDGTFPYNCRGGEFFDVDPLKPIEKRLQKSWPSYTCPQIGRKFWLHEWNKHGTCTKNILGVLPYLNAALYLKDRVNLLQALARARIYPNNQFYPLKSIKKAVARATGFHAWVNCNRNARGQSQIWQITLCTDRTGKRLIKCPFIPRGRNGCASNVFIPSF